MANNKQLWKGQSPLRTYTDSFQSWEPFLPRYLGKHSLNLFCKGLVPGTQHHSLLDAPLNSSIAVISISIRPLDAVSMLFSCVHDQGQLPSPHLSGSGSKDQLLMSLSFAGTCLLQAHSSTAKKMPQLHRDSSGWRAGGDVWCQQRRESWGAWGECWPAPGELSSWGQKSHCSWTNSLACESLLVVKESVQDTEKRLGS